MKNLLIVIDDLEFKYFEFNKLVTNFWLIKEYLNRGNIVDITVKSNLYLKRDIPYALVYNTKIKNDNIIKENESQERCLNEYNIIFFRPDPPVDIDYINASYILSYVDKNSTFSMKKLTHYPVECITVRIFFVVVKRDNIYPFA